MLDRVVLVPCIYRNYFVTKNSFGKDTNNFVEKCVLTFYFSRKAVLRLTKIFAEEDRFTRSAENVVLRISWSAFRSALPNVDLKF